MTELEARLAENVDDDATWLVYGDWLLEQGDVRGTLVQLERRPDRAAVEQEIAALFQAHQSSWRGGLPDEVQVLGWRHGFITAIGIPWNDVANELLAQIAELPALRFARTLRLGKKRKPRDPDDDDGGDDDDGDDDDEDNVDYDSNHPPLIDASALRDLPLGRFTALELPYLPIGDDGAKSLAANPGLAKLHALDLRYGVIGDEGIVAIAGKLASVRRLHLQRNVIGAAGATALSRAKLPHLVELDLRYNKLGADGAQALATAPFLGQLAALRLYRADVSPDGVAALARAPLAPALRTYWRAP